MNGNAVGPLVIEQLPIEVVSVAASVHAQRVGRGLVDERPKRAVHLRLEVLLLTLALAGCAGSSISALPVATSPYAPGSREDVAYRLGYSNGFAHGVERGDGRIVFLCPRCTEPTPDPVWVASWAGLQDGINGAAAAYHVRRDTSVSAATRERLLALLAIPGREASQSFEELLRDCLGRSWFDEHALPELGTLVMALPGHLARRFP